MSWYIKEFLFKSNKVSFQTLVTYSVIDLAEYQMVIRAKKLNDDHPLKLKHDFALKEELDHAQMHTEMLEFYGDKFFKFGFLRKLYKNILTRIPKGVFWSTISWFEIFNAYFWLDFKETFELDKYKSLSPYKQNMLWHYAEEAAHGFAFWEDYEKIASDKKRKKDGYYYWRNLTFICSVIMVSMLFRRPLVAIRYIPGYFSYVLYAANVAKKIAYSTPEERAKVLFEAKEHADQVKENIVARYRFK